MVRMGGIKSLVGKAAAGAGIGMIAGMVAPGLVANPLIRHGLAFVFAGLPGVAGSYLASGGMGSANGGLVY